MNTKKATMRRAIGIHGIFGLLFLLVFLLLTVVFSEEEYPILSYILYFAEQWFAVLSPAIVFAFLFVLFRTEKVGKCILSSLLITLSDFAVYGVYVLFSLSEKYYFGAAVLLSLAEALAEVILNTAIALLMLLVAAVTLKIRTGSIRPSLAVTPCFSDLEPAETSALFFGCLPPFLFLIGKEIAATVSYLADYAGSYETQEILFMICCYLVIFAGLLLSYLFSVKTAGKYVKCKENTEVENHPNESD